MSPTSESCPDIEGIIRRYSMIDPGKVAELYIKLLKFRTKQLEDAIKDHREHNKIFEYNRDSDLKLWTYVD